MDPAELKQRAEELLSIVQRQARRPYVVELTGTPKSGKTTSLATLQGFFKACGYRVQLQKERAADCPLLMKAHFFFNAWTTTTMLAEVIAAVETNADLILLDRAFFDALIWLELQKVRGQVSEAESRIFADFVLLDRWRSLVDVTVLMTAKPDVALARENQNAILRRSGSVMNTNSLNEFNDVLASVRARHESQFQFIEVDSSTTEIVPVNTHLVERLLEQIGDWVDPPIAVVDRSEVVSLFDSGNIIAGEEVRSRWASLVRLARPMQRSQAERDERVVQLVSCGMCISDQSILVLQRSQRDEKSSSYGPYTLWKGCHIEMRGTTDPTAEVAASSLVRRLESDLHLKQVPKPNPLAIVWDQTSPESQHLGLVFALPIDDKAIIRSLSAKEFRKGARGHKLVGRLASSDELKGDMNKFEPWSRALIEKGVVP